MKDKTGLLTPQIAMPPDEAEPRYADLLLLIHNYVAVITNRVSTN